MQLQYLIALAVLVTVAIALVAAWWLTRRPRPLAADAEVGVPRYPIVLVHGFMGFDEIGVLGRRAVYFRGIADALEAAGAKVYAVRLPPTASVEARARSLATFVERVEERKVNIVAHSMGGIDARFAIAELGLAPRVASLVTIGTPHLGTPLAAVGNSKPARAVRALLERLGISADATDWLTPETMAAFNARTADVDGVHYASVVGAPSAATTSLALKTSRMLLYRRAGSNDGVVPCESQAWGEVICETEADHWAQIGWAPGFDPRPLYRTIANHLARRGL